MHGETEKLKVWVWGQTAVFFFVFFFLADLSYVGFVLVGDVLDIQRWKTNFTFCVQK